VADRPTILITGGCGFLGQHVLTHLAATSNATPPGRPPTIVVLDLEPPAVQIFDFDAAPHVRILLDRDIRQYEAIAPAFQGVHCVIHLAGLVSFAWRDRHRLHDINVQGTANVVRAARQYGVRRLIHVSSVAALGYGDDPDHPIDEDYRFDWSVARRRGKFYMLTKHLADDQITRRAGDMPCVTVYPGLMFGPGDQTNTARLIRAIARRRVPLNMPGGTNIVDVRDVARGITMVLARPDVTGHFLLAGRNLTFRNINTTIARELGVHPPRHTLGRWTRPLLVPLLRIWERCSPRPPALTADQLDSAYLFRYFDHTRARDRLGWEPQIPFEQTIRDTIAWMKADGRFEG